jgi:hypothetical protein
VNGFTGDAVRSLAESRLDDVFESRLDRVELIKDLVLLVAQAFFAWLAALTDGRTVEEFVNLARLARELFEARCSFEGSLRNAAKQ